MDDRAVLELVYGRQQAGPGLGPLVVLMLVLAMLVLAYAIVVFERKVRRGDFSADLPEWRPPHIRGFPVVMPVDTPPAVDSAERSAGGRS